MFSRRFFAGARTYATYKRFNNTPSFNYNSLYKNRNIQLGLVAIGGFVLFNLEEAPVTHRLRFMCVPYSVEKMLGDYTYRQMMSEFGPMVVPQSNPIYRKTRKIVDRLLDSAFQNTEDPVQLAHLKKLDWKIHIIDGGNKFPPNAFVLPNGNIFIFSSILPICQNDDGIATVLSHELSHQLARHSSESLLRSPLTLVLSMVAWATFQNTGISDILINTLFKLPKSRSQETEADKIGCELMARACFDINEPEKFWRRMESAESSGMMKRAPINEFLSTHPGTARRIHDIHLWKPELQNIKESSCHERYLFDQAQLIFR